MRKVIFLLISFLVLPSYHGYANSIFMAKTPEVSIAKVEFVDWLENDLRLNITFAVDNQNDIDAEIKAIRYEMLVMGRLISKDYRDLTAVIEANKISYLAMPISINAIQLFSAVPDALLSNQISYSVSGAVAIKDLIIQIPFSKDGRIPLLVE